MTMETSLLHVILKSDYWVYFFSCSHFCFPFASSHEKITRSVHFLFCFLKIVSIIWHMNLNYRFICQLHCAKSSYFHNYFIISAGSNQTIDRVNIASWIWIGLESSKEIQITVNLYFHLAVIQIVCILEQIVLMLNDMTSWFYLFISSMYTATYLVPNSGWFTTKK